MVYHDVTLSGALSGRYLGRARLDFANVKLALVVPHQHPPDIAVATSNASAHGALQTHCDGTHSVYITAPLATPLNSWNPMTRSG